MKTVNELIKDINSLTSHLHEKDFLLTWEQTPDELKQVLDVAAALKALRAENISTKVFNSGLGISVFRDNSTRTNMISFCADAIGIRDDMYLGAGNAYMREVGAALDDGYKQGVLPQRPALVNLQCDIDHPTQSMADLAWLREHFGSLENLKGKKIAMTWAYSPSYGKPLSVPQGIIGLMTRFGMDVTLAHPEGYDLIPDVVEVAKNNAKASGGSFRQVTSMEEAFKDADIVYPKSWAPYKVMEERTELLRANDHEGLKALEKQCLAQNAQHKDWHCTEEMMELTRDGEALYMHCLPADISGVSCKEGEVTEGVFEKYRIATYKEASWKPYIIAAMILSRKYAKPGALLEQLLKEAQERVK
ncbi:aspartate/ornithine carbamoyltransferase family protein [Shigella sonnei]|uniref:knotted carbamoyltransferase YgeW n=1 Tax=Shigella sonnei TaxID=624 RepID=UPI000662FD00|nr:knotted carbamoyltransferase YgeW [Shigella sonnei]CSF98312.1 aspartate/ornithine carbamoyltransferase family protein [Shigella sonnei]